MLVRHERPHPSIAGVGLALLTLVVVLFLARAKSRAAAGLDRLSRSDDVRQTVACSLLAFLALLGLGLNAAFSCWWGDSAAAALMSTVLIHEGRAEWRGEPEGDS
jgi:divalent metal cation (Fe/Co/Zn/Cd) transporter